ncbi:toxin-antitoxin system YwqK family antitoxin [Wenyingzhuangia sp. 2_MG-2023]|uniref:toxin-antitoxin system YwqK family antitoxin n=1 Tax=Wenyingzhuangia sp. 2_MG-2023 TaxID=3062639 RepID=UPI0026E47FC3|nr:hypothetical protein [Wenyingzhuangia sp. 2_MG-2023]MDO6739167.1 hypothetical protein [Wenyingzhuangia sp. 2_MG-2023]
MKKKIVLAILLTVLMACQQEKKLEYSQDFVEKNRVLYHLEEPYTGRVYQKYNDTLLRFDKQYKSGLLNGVSKKWYSNGVLAEFRVYQAGNKVKTHKGWWSNGNQKFIFTYNDEGVYHGNAKEWFENGQLYKDFNYTNGHEEGSQKMYLNDGTYRANYVIKNGEKFGLIGSKGCDGLN